MSRFFINRPIVAIVISILTVIVGLVSLLGLPVAQFPKIVPPEGRITTTYVGADAQTVEQSVATPIEQQMSGVDNMNYMYSINGSDGSLRLTTDFDVATDPNTDLILSQMRVTQANPQLPADVAQYGVTVQKSLSAPLLLFALYSPRGTYDSTFLANYAYINLNDALTRVPGIASVTVFGAGQYAMRYWVKPDQLAKLNITVGEVIQAIQAQNTVNPAGQIGAEPAPAGQDFTYSVRAQGRLTSPEEFGRIVVRENPDGSVVRLQDVARVELGAQVYNVMGRLNGKPAAIVAVYQLPGSNALDAAVGAKRAMAELKSRFPSDLDYIVALDTTLAVSEGIREISTTLWEALLLVMLVVFVFLQGWRATLIPLLAVPVSLIGTFAVFPLFGFSINTLSLFGLVLAIGLVVDDAIVVVEAVEHHIEEGLSPHDATLRAMHEVSGPVVAIAIILAAVFIPTAFIPGITGRLYQQFALTIAISVIISAFNALSLSPALCAMLLRPRQASSGPLGRFYGWFNRGLRPGDRRLRRHLPGADPQERGERRHPRRLRRRRAPLRPPPADRVPARRGPGLLLRPAAAPQRGLPAAHRRGGRAGGGDPEGHPRGPEIHLGDRLQPPQHGLQHLQRLLFRHLQAVVGADQARGALRRDQGPPERGAAQAAGRHRLRLRPAGHPGRRDRRRRHLRPGGPVGPGHRLSRRQRQQVHRGGPQAPGAGERHHDLPARGPAGLRRGRPRQGAEAGREPAPTSTGRSSATWAASSSTTSTASAGSGRFMSRPRASTATGPSAWRITMCATATARWSRCPP